MKDMVRMAAIVAISMLVAVDATAQQASPPAKPAAASESTAAAGAAPATEAPKVATVSNTNGKAMLNRASVYEVAKKDQRLQKGDRLVVLEGGAVSVQFDGGCVVTIDTAQVYTVPEAPPCAPGAAERGVRAPAPASGSGAAAAAESSQYMKWGLVALGVATPLLLLSNSNQGSPISP
jgi:hypothetical protein